MPSPTRGGDVAAALERLARYSPWPYLQYQADLHVVAQALIEARRQAIEECAAIVEAVATEHRQIDKDLNDRIVADGGKRYKACGDEGYFCEDFGCGSFIDLATEIRALLFAAHDGGLERR